MYADVRIRELTTDTTAPTITVRNVPDGLCPARARRSPPDYACADEQDLVECSATAIDVATPGTFTFRVTAKDAAGNETSSAARTPSSPTPRRQAAAGGTVPRRSR